MVITLLLSLTASSQTVTNKTIDTCKVVLSCETARKIAVDLVQGDSAKAELGLTQELLKQTEQKVVAQDTIIKSYVVKTQVYEQQINLYTEKEEKYKQVVFGLQEDKRKLKTGIKILGVTVGILTITTVIGFLF